MNLVEEVRRVAGKRGWKALFLDVDDTCIDSDPTLWNPAFTFAADAYADFTGKTGDEMFKELWRVNHEEYMKDGGKVHPSKYARVAERMAEEQGIDSVWAKAIMKQAVAMIYLGTPPLLPGAEQAIEIADQAGLRVGFVTHSPKGRASRLVKAWGLDGKAAVFTESTLKNKGIEVWQRAIDGLEITGPQAVAVDDRLQSLEAARKAGISDLLWVKPRWKDHSAGNSEGMVQIENIGQLVTALISKFK